ncbi:MAG TPA: LON peptidase substrate-binding domain-containing protein [Dokdonella sp.]|uniref:LON peptidase substrate-binding domain-containing protein n=1 Tax=Dokdonella sp. TaxID=2291710 RepID=UPI002BD04ECB|nr:LON peptidase substrate-binding domain-containing protein [Dokdonella sp.]HOX72838.1 LON peptidase substrate-binding domain-containing protein [Dokdonella sp.]HPG95492.1 LON peptidase substrate-binding domain-containing protein [Dokdonella sp.]HPN79809.1 LON peptidase substrate-binding domain-containing protein [Dokdonella sp.]
MPTADLPLFPLSTVLFPGGLMSLRIFETRYLDMIRDCARHGSGFGVCVILAGNEAGDPAVPAAVGTLAHIVDFHVLSDGLLGIHARGSERFHVQRTHVRDNGLIHGDVAFRAESGIEPVPPEFTLLATILERFHEKAGGEHAQVERGRYDDAAWVGYRLAEALPLDRADQQRLLQLDDPIDRLKLLMYLLLRFQNA